MYVNYPNNLLTNDKYYSIVHNEMKVPYSLYHSYLEKMMEVLYIDLQPKP